MHANTLNSFVLPGMTFQGDKIDKKVVGMYPFVINE